MVEFFVMGLVEEIMSRIAAALNGTMNVNLGGIEIDLTPSWKRLTMSDAICEHIGRRLRGKDLPELRQIANELHVEETPGT